MVFIFFPALLSCKKLILKDFIFWHRAQNRPVCKQLISRCTLCLSFTSDSLGRLIGQMWTCKKYCWYLSWFWAKYFPPLPLKPFFMDEWGRWAGCRQCLFSIASVSSGEQVTMMCIWLLSCAWGISRGVRKSWLFGLTWNFSKGLGLASSPQWNRAMRI